MGGVEKYVNCIIRSTHLSKSFQVSEKVKETTCLLLCVSLELSFDNVYVPTHQYIMNEVISTKNDVRRQMFSGIFFMFGTNSKLTKNK